MPKKKRELKEPTPNTLPPSYYHMKSEVVAMFEGWDTELERYEVDATYINKRTGFSLYTINQIRKGKVKLDRVGYKNFMKLYNLAMYCRKVGKLTAETRMKLGQERPKIRIPSRKVAESYLSKQKAEAQQLEIEKDESEGTLWTP